MNKRILIVAGGVIVVALATILLYVFSSYYKPHRKVEQETAAKTVKATALFEEYSQDEEKANKNYLNQVIGVEGMVKEVKAEGEETILILDSGDEIFGVNCTIDATEKKENVRKLKTGEEVKLKGVCTGMTMDVVLIKCFITK